MIVDDRTPAGVYQTRLAILDWKRRGLKLERMLVAAVQELPTVHHCTHVAPEPKISPCTCEDFPLWIDRICAVHTHRCQDCGGSGLGNDPGYHNVGSDCHTCSGRGLVTRSVAAQYKEDGKWK